MNHPLSIIHHPLYNTIKFVDLRSVIPRVPAIGRNGRDIGAQKMNLADGGREAENGGRTSVERTDG